MLAGVIYDLSHLGLRHFETVYTAHAYPLLMYLKHDLYGFGFGLAEKILKNMDNKIHWRVVIIQHQDLV